MLLGYTLYLDVASQWTDSQKAVAAMHYTEMCALSHKYWSYMELI